MDVHLIAIEVSVIGAAVSVVHPDCLLLGQDFSEMRHHTWFMEGWLSVHEQDITVAQMSVHDFLTNSELVGKAISLLLRHILKHNLLL